MSEIAGLAGRNLYGIFQCFKGSYPYHPARSFCLIGHWLLGERVDAFMLAGGRLVNNIQLKQAWDKYFAWSSLAELLGNHRVDRVKRGRGLLFIETAFLGQGGHKLGLAHSLVGHFILFSNLSFGVE